jgi:hypothetical protein
MKTNEELWLGHTKPDPAKAQGIENQAIVA